ncbi:MAG: hypothetical protein MHM6MM_003948 [Cercozoa sp. M6MM]
MSCFGGSGNRKPLQLEFKDVTFHARDMSGQKDETGHVPMRQILHGISGVFHPGKLTAIMGSSGAGKTTLLNILSKRTRTQPGRVEVGGSILLNNTEATKRLVRKNSAYIMQEDILLPTMTVREALRFSAKMRLPATLTDAEVEDRVTALIGDLRLDKCADTMVGSAAKRGLSGGEMKRASIGVELVSNPSLLFVDEPTSGLDSFTAASVVELLRDLARDGRTVISTIHQPSSEIFSMFDALMLLVDGEVIYYGSAKGVADYFASIGFVCPPNYNIADFYIQIMQGRGEQADQDRETLKEAWRRRLQEEGEMILPIEDPSVAHIDMNEKRSNRIGFGAQVRLLAQRALRHFTRTPKTFKARIGQIAFLSLLMGALFWQMEDDQVGAQDRQGLIFFAMISTTMQALMATALTFPEEKTLFLREHSNGVYSLGAYFLGKLVSEVPFQFLWPALQTAIIYPMCGLRGPFYRVLIFYGVTCLLTLVGMGLGYLIGAVAPSVDVASGIAPVTVIPLMQFSGFLVNLDSISPAISWIQWISVFKYIYEVLAVNEFDGATFSCTQDQLVQGVCPITRGEQVLGRLELSADNIGRDIGVSVAMLILFWGLAYLVLRSRTKRAAV